MQLTDAQWARIAPLMSTLLGNCKLSSRRVLDDWLSVTKGGCSWQALPERYGPWHTVQMRGWRWIEKGVLERVSAELQRDELDAQAESGQPDQPVRVALDGTMVKVHQDGTGEPRNRGANRSATHAAA